MRNPNLEPIAEEYERFKGTEHKNIYRKVERG